MRLTAPGASGLRWLLPRWDPPDPLSGLDSHAADAADYALQGAVDAAVAAVAYWARTDGQGAWASKVKRRLSNG